MQYYSQSTCNNTLIMVRTVDIRLGKIKWDSQDCPDPIVKIAGAQNLAINCINDATNTYRVQTIDGSGLPNCITFVVTCGSCSTCPPQAIERCLCDSQNPCTEPCTECINNICVPRCAPEDCINGRCVDCKSNSDCPCNQVCTPSGCACPPNTSLNPITKCCDECATDRDCGPCAECVNINGAMTCVPIKCPDGVCDPTTGNCVECLTSGDCANKDCKQCDPVLKRCVAGPGQIQVGNTCKDAGECITDGDCNDPCLACDKSNRCVPIQCPPGKVPYRTGNICTCIEQCDCGDPGSCSDVTKYCTAIDNINCGCLPCQGDCANGCKPPCYCSPVLNKCVTNPCNPAPCTDGIDCGPGCGCLNGTCMPCNVLNCTTQECAKALGCKCVGATCIADDCNNEVCTTFTDCPVGCTCVEGRCVGCSNFSCSPINKCSTQPGCLCKNGECIGDDSDHACADTLTIEKDDCDLVGKLNTQNCCQCIPISAIVKGRRVSTSSSEHVMQFITELRKGVYVSGNPNFFPLLDDVAHPDIAENEVPTEGSFKMVVTASVRTTDVITGQDSFITEEIAQHTVNYDGSAAIRTFASGTVTLPAIDTVITDGNMLNVYEKITISVFQNSNLSVPNKCVYRNRSQKIAEYVLYDNSDYDLFDSSDYVMPKGTSIKTNSCRDPFFRWYKGNEVIRKVYAPSAGGVYRDIITKQNTPELESCYTYTLEVDCGCDKTASKNIVFCSPLPGDGNIDYDITNCGRTITLTRFEPCDTNKTQDYYFRGGSIDEVINYQDLSLPYVMNSETCVKELAFGLVCDTNKECEYILRNECEQDEIIAGAKCQNGKVTIRIDYNNQDISYINVYRYDNPNQLVYTINAPQNSLGRLDPGKYKLVVHPPVCDPYELVVEDNCCNDIVPNIRWNCETQSLECEQIEGYQYLINGVVQNDVCRVLQTSMFDDVSVLVKKPNCPDHTFVIQSLCRCGEPKAIVDSILGNVAIIRLIDFPAAGQRNIRVSPSGPIVESVEPTPGQPVTKYKISNLNTNTKYTVTASHTECQIDVDLEIKGEECDIDVRMFYEDAPGCNTLAGQIGSPQDCTCREGLFETYITNVDNTNDDYVEITLSTKFDNFDAKPVGGTVVVSTSDAEQDLGCQTCENKSFKLAKNKTEDECLNSYQFTVWRDPNDLDTLYVEVLYKFNNIHLDPPDGFEGAEVMVNYRPLTEPNINDPAVSRAAYCFYDCCPSNNTTIDFIIKIDGKEYRIYDDKLYDIPMDTRNYSWNILPCVKATSNSSILPFTVTLKDLVLEDDCEYPDVDIAFNVHQETGVVSPPQVPVKRSLVATNPDDRLVKFIWQEQMNSVGSFVTKQVEFADIKSTYRNTLDQRATYRLTAYCGGCNASDTKYHCCIPRITPTMNSNNLIITLTGNRGEYDYYLLDSTDAVVEQGTILVANQVAGNEFTGDSKSMTYPLGETLTIVVVERGDQRTSQCRETLEIMTTVPQCEISYSDFAPDGTYSATLTNWQPGWQIQLLSGSGSVQQDTIVGIDPTNPATIRILDTTTGIASQNCVLLQDPTAPSSIVPSSSRLPSIKLPSVAAPSSTSVAPPICDSYLTISQNPRACTYTTRMTNGSNNMDQLNIEYNYTGGRYNNPFLNRVQSFCETIESCTSSVVDLSPAWNQEFVLIQIIQYDFAEMFASDITYDRIYIRSVGVQEGGDVIAIPTAPGTAVEGCAGCLPIADQSHLLYSKGAGNTWDQVINFKKAIYAAIHNYLVDNGYQENVDFLINAYWSDVGAVDIGPLIPQPGTPPTGFGKFHIVFALRMNNNGHIGLKLSNSLLNATYQLVEIVDTRGNVLPSSTPDIYNNIKPLGGVAYDIGAMLNKNIITVSEFGPHVIDDYAQDLSQLDSNLTVFINSANCSYTNPCGVPGQTDSQQIRGYLNQLRYNTTDLNVQLLTPRKTHASTCSHVQLVANLVNCPNPSYIWSGTHSNGATTQSIEVPLNSGTYVVEVSNCPNCPTLDKSVNTNVR